jgi:hypothetical protein
VTVPHIFLFRKLELKVGSRGGIFRIPHHSSPPESTAHSSWNLVGNLEDSVTDSHSVISDHHAAAVAWELSSACCGENQADEMEKEQNPPKSGLRAAEAETNMLNAIALPSETMVRDLEYPSSWTRLSLSKSEIPFFFF